MPEIQKLEKDIGETKQAIEEAVEELLQWAAANPIAEAFAGIHRLNAPGLPAGEADEGLCAALEALSQFGRRIAGARHGPEVRVRRAAWRVAGAAVCCALLRHRVRGGMPRGRAPGRIVHGGD